MRRGRRQITAGAGLLLPSLALLVGLGATGCSTSYRTLRMEFDSVSGFADVAPEPEGAGEPEELDYPGRARRWPWVVRNLEGSGFDVLLVYALQLQPGLVAIENPSGFLRQRLSGMVEYARGDLGRIAEVSHRLLWVLMRDRQPLDRMVMVREAGRLLGELGVDPLQVPWPARDQVARVAREQREHQFLADWLVAGARSPSTGAEHAALLRSLQFLAEQPSPAPPVGRRTIRLLTQAAARTRDPQLRRAARYALADRIGMELGHALRQRLLDPQPEVRETALLALHRHSGPAAVPFALAMLASRGGGPRYDADAAIRRLLLRLAAGLPHDLLYASFEGGPRPIEFLYDSATRDDRQGLRMVALDALSRALGRPVDLEPEWADSFWRAEALRRTGGGGGASR